MKVTFSDQDLHLRFAPLTLTRPVCELRFGMLSIRESWSQWLGLGLNDVFFETESYLSGKFPTSKTESRLIAGNVKPDAELAEWVKFLKTGEQLIVNGRWIASWDKNSDRPVKKNKADLLYIEFPWEIFQKLDAAMKLDFELIGKPRRTEGEARHSTIIGSDLLMGKNVKVSACIINTETGPVYLDDNAEIMEGALIRGPFYLGKHSIVKMGAKIYGATSIGPECRIGGEISNSIIQGYSNKGHDGFMGNSVIGEWCNLGADSNTSNLKNNYSPVNFYSYESRKMEPTPVTFLGTVMGDHAKTGINTMLNTATSVGVSANVFGHGFPPKFISSYAWSGFDDQRFDLGKALEVAENMMKRRNVELSPSDKHILSHLHGMA